MQNIGPAVRRGICFTVCTVRKEPEMPDREDLERRLWRTMPWDAEVMLPKDDEDDQEGEESDDD